MTKQELINLINDRDVVNAVADIITSAILSTNVENPSNKSIENPENTRITSTPVEVTERHVGCLVKNERREATNDVLWRRYIKDGYKWEAAGDFIKNAEFPDTYPIPIIHQWFGGPCPVDNDVMVLVQFEDESYLADTADWFLWTWDDVTPFHRIIGYTVLDVRGLK